MLLHTLWRLSDLLLRVPHASQLWQWGNSHGSSHVTLSKEESESIASSSSELVETTRTVHTNNFQDPQNLEPPRLTNSHMEAQGILLDTPKISDVAGWHSSEALCLLSVYTDLRIVWVNNKADSNDITLLGTKLQNQHPGKQSTWRRWSQLCLTYNILEQDLRHIV